MTYVSRAVRQALALAVVGTAMTAPALAHRRAPVDDPAAVSERLHRMGFMEWRELRYSHGYWKIDDARRDNGHVYDLKLEEGTLDIVRLKRESR